MFLVGFPLLFCWM